MRVMQSKEEIECFLYKVVQEPYCDSHGLYCAQLAGIPGPILHRAAQLKAMYDADIPPADLRFAKLDAGTEQEALAIIRSHFQ